ncbi:MAG: TraR/DksA family transcriptional regulator [Thermaurantimonas sp.]
MDKKTLESQIKDRIAKIQIEVQELKEMANPVAPDNAIGRVSRMDAINNKSIVEASLRNLENKLKGLEYALQNLSNPEFGYCAKCKQPIPEGRILLMPESRFCVKCS